MEISIVSAIEYGGRILAIIEIQNEDKVYRATFYRSTGSNVPAEGHWFPCAGIVGPGILKRHSTFDEYFKGQISKDFIYCSKDAMRRFDYILKRRDGHSDPELRWTAYYIDDIPFNIKEIAAKIKEKYDADPIKVTGKFKVGIKDNEIQFVNSWVFFGLNTIREESDPLE